MTKQQHLIATKFLGWELFSDDPRLPDVPWYMTREAQQVPEHESMPEPVSLPNLDTESGAALWCALMEGALEPLGDFDINWIQASNEYYVVLWSSTGVIRRLGDGAGPTKLDALTAAVLKLMEVNDG